MQEILFNKLPMIGLYFETSTVFYTKNFSKELSPKTNDIYNNIENMIIDTIPN